MFIINILLVHIFLDSRALPQIAAVFKSPRGAIVACRNYRVILVEITASSFTITAPYFLLMQVLLYAKFSAQFKYASIFDILSPCFGITIYILLTDTVFRSSNVLLHLPYSLKFSSSHFATLSESLFPIIPVASFLRLSTAFSTA